MSGWSEVAADVFQARYQPYDVTVAVVRGADGLLVVDTRGSHRQGLQLRSDLAGLGAPVRAVVNTHGHFDHAFGNDCFGAASDLDVPIHAHEAMPAHLRHYGARDLRAGLAEQTDEFTGTALTPPTNLVADPAAIDLGDREVVLRHLGRGHTDHDLVLHVAEAGVWLVGDLVEESGPPMCGEDGFPLDWPGTLDALLHAFGPDEVAVPGHGAVVGRRFVATKRDELEAVASLLGELHAAGVPVHQAVAAGGTRWPFPADAVRAAVSRGYAHLAGVGTAG